LIKENWEKYSQAQDELEELGHDSYNQQQREEMEERYCHLTGFIQTKLKEQSQDPLSVMLIWNQQ
jgi:hypothetical protein